jgi:hypothetical protein
MDSAALANLQTAEYWGSRYELQRLEELETRVLSDAAGGLAEHNPAAHLLTLKLYQIYPDRAKDHIKGVILAKALMALPSEVFTCCRFLLRPLFAKTGDTRIEQPDLVRKLLDLGEQLETGRFLQFWRIRRHETSEQTPLGQLLETVVDFDEGVRQFMISIMELAFQKVSARELSRLLNSSDIPNGWKMETGEHQDGVVIVRTNERELTRPKVYGSEQHISLERLIPVFARLGRETQRTRTRRRRILTPRRALESRQ